MEGLGGRIELIQVPQPRSAPDAFGDEHYTGYYHLSFDLTETTQDLEQWLEELKARFDRPATADDGTDSPLKVLLEPTQQVIGDRVYEVMFIADSDGLPLEFIRSIGPMQG
jgi:hypothetical protein